jgi:hypothetical protein
LVLGLSLKRLQNKQQAEFAQAAASASAPSPSATAPAPTAAPNESALAHTAADGESGDPNKLIEAAESKLHEGRDIEAVKALATLLGKHPDRRNDPRVSQILFRTASSNAKGVSNMTFSLLQGAMAARGAEIVYQLAIDRSIPAYVSARAEKWLRTPQFERASSDALRVAASLRLATTCEAKHAVLPMAGRSGGRAALEYLHELQRQTGCGLSGKDDCYRCLRGDDRLKDAIAQVESRVK